MENIFIACCKSDFEENIWPIDNSPSIFPKVGFFRGVQSLTTELIVLSIFKNCGVGGIWYEMGANVASKEENIAEIRRYFGEISVCRWVPTRHTAEIYRRSTLGQHRRSTVKMELLELFSSCCWGDSNPQQKISMSGPVPLGQTCSLINMTL